MRIAEYKQTGTETITNIITVDDYDQDGNIIGQHEEAVTREVPIMSMVYRDMTPEEEAEALEQQRQAEEWERTRPRTTDERLDAYAEESDDAFFDLAEYAASLEEQLAALTARVTALEV